MSVEEMKELMDLVNSNSDRARMASAQVSHVVECDCYHEHKDENPWDLIKDFMAFISLLFLLYAVCVLLA